MKDYPTTAFRRSSFCNAGDCVEVAPLGDGRIAIRDSKDNRRTQLVFTREEWATFLRGAKTGEFDFDTRVSAGVDSATVRLTL